MQLSRAFGEFFARRGTLSPEVAESIDPLREIDLQSAITALSTSILNAMPASDTTWAEDTVSETVSEFYIQANN